MKRKLLFISIFACALFSCTPNNSAEKQDESVKLSIDTITLNGHRYLNVSNQFGVIIGVVHDPNCECITKVDTVYITVSKQEIEEIVHDVIRASLDEAMSNYY